MTVSRGAQITFSSSATPPFLMPAHPESQPCPVALPLMLLLAAGLFSNDIELHRHRSFYMFPDMRNPDMIQQ